MFPKVFKNTTNSEILMIIKDIFNDIIENIEDCTNLQNEEDQVGIAILRYRKQRLVETKALLSRNCLRKMMSKKVPTPDSSSMAKGMTKICKKNRKFENQQNKLIMENKVNDANKTDVQTQTAHAKKVNYTLFRHYIKHTGSGKRF